MGFIKEKWEVDRLSLDLMGIWEGNGFISSLDSNAHSGALTVQKGETRIVLKSYRIDLSLA